MNGALRLTMNPVAMLPNAIDSGDLFVATDTQELYIDTPNDVRIRISDIHVVSTINARDAIVSPLANKFYYVQATNTFYTYNSSTSTWSAVGSGVFTDSSNQVLADKLRNGINVSLTGPVTGSVVSDMSASFSIATSIAASGVVAGSYGNSGDISATGGSTFVVPKFTVGSDGRITQIDTDTITMPSSMGMTNAVLTNANNSTGAVGNIANGSVYLNMIQDSSVVKSFNIVGRGGATVTGDNGAIVVTSANDDTTYQGGSGISVVANNSGSGEDYIINHSNSITAGTASGEATGTKNFGETVDLPTVTYDAQGHVTAKGTTTVTLPTLAGGSGISIGSDSKTINHSNSVTAGTASGTSGTVGFGGSISIPSIAYDAQGHITSATTTSVTLPSTPTDKDVATSASSTTKFYVAGTTSSTGGDGALVIDPDVYVDNESGKLHATTFDGTSFTGTADKATKDASGNTITNTYAPLASPALTGTPTAPTAVAGTNSTQIATTAFVANAIAALGDVLNFKGTMGTSGTVTGIPTAYNAGDEYKIITAGTYAGHTCEVGDLIIAMATRSTGTGIDADWCVVQGNIDGAITAGQSGSATEISVTKPNASTIQVTHNSSGATAGTYGNSATSPSIGGTITVPKVTVNATGHVTAIEDVSVTVPSPAAGTGISVSNGTINHSNSVTAGTASGSGTTSGSPTAIAFGGTVNLPTVTYDAQGHVTAAGTSSVALPTLAGGTGISIASDGKTINHSNSISAGTVSPSTGTVTDTINIPSINYDAQGHITGSTANNITLDFVHMVKSTSEPSSNLQVGMVWLNFALSTS